jgi:NADH-quinone oxidoreductase subunit L
MPYATCFGLFLPLLGFLLLVLFSQKISRRWAGLIGCGAILASFLCFVSMLEIYTYRNLTPLAVTLYKWIPLQGLDTNFTLVIDPLSLLMTLIITGIGFLIHVYSIGYMEHDVDYARYFAFLNFFVFAMLLLVLAGNLLLLFVGWEGVGLASYLLIGFWYERPAAARAAIKAFVVNRIGDLGLLLGIILTFYVFGTSDMMEISQRASQGLAAGTALISLIVLLYFIGAIGKSAQLPLHVWLPDAMEGPTPVSALIHAATMVTAGVYLIVRMHSLFILAPVVLNLIGMIGAFTALFAALCALGQIDLKRVLAYSTISQLGYMFLACGAGAFYSAMFHLTTHAFVKALLFLSAGNVLHMMHGNTDMNKMGGLSKNLPVTRWLFFIGVLALSGIPPLATFFSKDLILEQELFSGFTLLFSIGLITAILTGFYLARAHSLTFLGKPRQSHETVHEAPRVMLIPVIILAFLSVTGGFLGFAFAHKVPILEGFLKEIGLSKAEQVVGESWIYSPETWIATTAISFSIFLALVIYTYYTNALGNTFAVLRKEFYIDEIYAFILVKPLRALSKWLSHFVEPEIFEAGIKDFTQGVQIVSRGLQRMQSGQIRSYVAWMVGGMVFLIVYLL